MNNKVSGSCGQIVSSYMGLSRGLMYFAVAALLILAFSAPLSPAFSAEETNAKAFIDDLNAQFQTLRKELLEELGPDFPLTSAAIEERMKQLDGDEAALEKRLHEVIGNIKVSSDDVSQLRTLASSLYSSYTTYNFARKDAEQREEMRKSRASRDIVSPDAEASALPNMGLKQSPPYSIETYDNAYKSLDDKRKRLSFELFSLRASEKAARESISNIRNKKTQIANFSDKKLGDQDQINLLIARLELELARVNAAIQMSSIREGITNSNSQVATINIRAKQIEWMKQNLSFNEGEENKIIEKYNKEFEKAGKFLQEAREKNSAAERGFMHARNRLNSGTEQNQQTTNSTVFARYFYTRFLLTFADDIMNYTAEAMDVWKSRYALYAKKLSGNEIWALREKATKRIQELENKLEYLRRTQIDISTREKELLARAADEKDSRQRKLLLEQASSYRGMITDIIERYATDIPNHIFLFQRLHDEAGQNLDTIRLAQKVTATGKDIFFTIMNTKLWEGEGYNFTVEKLLLALGVLLFGLYGSRLMSRFVQKIFMSRLSSDVGAAVAVQRLLHYFILFIFILLALQFVNIPLTAFAFLGGALALGFGFGAQNFFNNIISGFILMFSSPFKVGDIVDIDGTVGTIMDIGERATLLRTFTNLEMAVPNSYLLQNKVTNWTSSDQTKRETVQVGVSYRSDPKEVREILYDTLARHKEIMKKPEPYVIFKDFGDSSLVFELYYWVNLKKSNSMKIGSDIRYIIMSEFGKRGIEIPYPQLDLHIQPRKREPQAEEDETPHLPK